MYITTDVGASWPLWSLVVMVSKHGKGSVLMKEQGVFVQISPVVQAMKLGSVGYWPGGQAITGLPLTGRGDCWATSRASHHRDLTYSLVPTT